MQRIQLPTQMRAWSAAQHRQGRRLAFVPTMGALHEGHLKLVDVACAHADDVVVSIFVNPSQFGPEEDLVRYPRRLEADAALCAARGVAALFCPEAAAMYATDHSAYVVEGRLTRGLCGPFRPGHFRGVLTVVSQLFHDVQPDIAVFGQKDAQQARLIQRMVRDLHFPIQILVAPIVREADGLAMSSRNQYLQPDERARARVLSEALRHAEARYASGMRDAAVVCDEIKTHIEGGTPAVTIEYVQVVDLEQLAPVGALSDGCLLALCVRIGKTRLLDNVILGRDRVAASFGLV